MKKLPGIFNDVIGPIMRGPSSSHTAASWRAAKMSMDLLNEPLKKAIIDFDKDGAWAPNYRAQGTTLGIDGGLLGLEMADDRMKHTEQVADEMGIKLLPYQRLESGENNPTLKTLIKVKEIFPQIELDKIA